MTTESTPTNDKQITVDVPEDRVAEFYAFYGRFLAGFPGRRQRRRSPHGCGPHREVASQAQHDVPAGREAREA